MTGKLRKTIAWWQIACAALGLLIFVAADLGVLPNGRQWVTQTIGLANFARGLVFFAFALAAGWGLLREQRWAVVASLLVQVVQAVLLAVLGGPHVEIAAGPTIDLTVGSDQVAANVGFHSSFFIGTRIEGPVWDVTVNLLAVLWAIALARMLWYRREEIVAVAV